MKTLASALILSAAGLVAAASELPPLTFPEGVGVNIHFTRGHGRDLDLIAAGGFKFVRMDFGWGGIERKHGEYDWSAYDDLTADLEKRGLRAVYIFDYSNGLYEDALTAVNPVTGKEQRDTASPHKPESVAAFARWAAASAEHFKGRHIGWEIWNEPNIGFWKPKPNAKDYSTLVLATCKAVRAADPSATIMGPASSEFPWPFLEELFKSGALEYLDAVSVHPYRNYSKGPETAGEEYFRLRTLIERYAPAGKKGMPIVSGEWGYATHTKGVSLETQAAFIARQQIANVWQGVPISIWYDWKNDGDDSSYNENNFGTVSNNLALKPSYVAVQTLARELKGYHIARRLQIGSEQDFVLLCVNADGKQKLAGWTTGQPHSVPLSGITSAENVSIVSGKGEPIALPANLALSIDALPCYVTLKKPSRSLEAAAAWSIDDHVPVTVRAGGNDGLTVPVRVTNPFATAVVVNLGIESAAGQASQELRVAPHESASHAFTLRPPNRSPSKESYAVTAAFLAGTGGEIGVSTERRHFTISNPLLLSIVPVENGLRLMVSNPSGTAFSGAAQVEGTEIPIQLSEGTLDKELNIPRSANEANVRLLDNSSPGQPATDVVHARFVRLPLNDLNAALDGDAKVAATATISTVDLPADTSPPMRRGNALKYSFDAGWRFVRVAKGGKQLVFEGEPRALGVWVHGDGSGNSLRMRVADAGGQTFQPTGPRLDWKGWRWVQFDLKRMSDAGHWGGANDGVVHGPLKLDTLLLVDGARNKTSGTIYLTGPALVY